MPFYYQFQRVRIVNATWDDCSYPELVGTECTLMKPETCTTGARDTCVPCWLTDLPHPVIGVAYNYCVLESQIEPIQYDFDKEEEENIMEELELEKELVPIFVRQDRWDNNSQRYY